MPEKHSRISPNTTPFINPLPSNQRLITTYTRPPITPEASPTPMISPKVPPAVISPAMLPFSVVTPACSSLTIAKIRIMSRLPMPATKIPAAIPTDGPMSNIRATRSEVGCIALGLSCELMVTSRHLSSCIPREYPFTSRSAASVRSTCSSNSPSRLLIPPPSRPYSSAVELQELPARHPAVKGRGLGEVAHLGAQLEGLG